MKLRTPAGASEHDLLAHILVAAFTLRGEPPNDRLSHPALVAVLEGFLDLLAVAKARVDLTSRRVVSVTEEARLTLTSRGVVGWDRGKVDLA